MLDWSFDLCRPLVVSAPTVDKIIYMDGRMEERLGGPLLHTAWLASAYQVSTLTSLGVLHKEDLEYFRREIEGRGGKARLVAVEENTAKVVLDYTGSNRRVFFESTPPRIRGDHLLEAIEEDNPMLVFLSPVYDELPVDLALEAAKKIQWSILDLQGYLRSMPPGDALSIMPRRSFDVVHLSDDDLPRREFDYLIDDVASVSRHSVIYTMGAEGAVLLDSEGNPRLRAKPSQDYVGSEGVGGGDVFSLSYGLFLCSTWEPRKAFIEALLTSSYYVLKGPRPPRYSRG